MKRACFWKHLLINFYRLHILKAWITMVVLEIQLCHCHVQQFLLSYVHTFLDTNHEVSIREDTFKLF
jgi:hypothetical protein